MLTNGLYGIGMSRWLLMLVSSAKAQMRQLGPHLLKSLHVPSPCLKSIPPHAPIWWSKQISGSPACLVSVEVDVCHSACVFGLWTTSLVCCGDTRQRLPRLPGCFPRPPNTHLSRADVGTWLTATGAGDVSSDEPSYLALAWLSPTFFSYLIKTQTVIV